MDFSEYRNQQKERIRDQRWLDDIFSKGCYCHICGYVHPLIIQKHHFAGKNNSEVEILVCPNCHTILTMKQKSWDHRWTTKEKSKWITLALILRGISDILSMCARELKKQSDWILEMHRDE